MLMRSVLAIAISPDGKTLIFGAAGAQIVAVDLASGEQIASTSLPGKLLQLQHANAGERVVAAALDENNWEGAVWDYRRNQWEHRRQAVVDKWRRQSVVSPDAASYAAVNASGDVELCDLKTGRPMRRASHCRYWWSGLR